jgi:hypothetical protein
MMTLAELQTANVNPLIAREAYEQADKRLADTLATKLVFEQKAFTLFAGYLTISLALFSAGGAVYGIPQMQHLAVPFWLTGLIYVAGSILFAIALIDQDYGAVASHPDMWLNAGTIDGPDAVLPTMLAYIAFYHQRRIDTSIASNRAKAKWIRMGIYAGIVAPVLFMGFVLAF